MDEELKERATIRLVLIVKVGREIVVKVVKALRVGISCVKLVERSKSFCAIRI